MKCSYSHDVSDETRFPDLNGTWECPRDSIPDANYCLFHTPVTHTVRRNKNITEAFLDIIEKPKELATSPQTTQNRFIGVTLPALDVSYRVLQGETTYPIDLRDATIRGDINCQQAEIAFPILFDGATIRGELRLQSATLKKRLSAERTTIAGGIVADDATFTKQVAIEDAQIQGPVLLREASCEAGFTLQNCTTTEKCVLHGATIDGPLRFSDTEFRSPLNLERVVVAEDASFDRIHCHRSLRVTGATFDEHVTFGDATVKGSAQFTTATFKDVVELTAARLTDRCDFRHVTATTATFDNTSFDAPAKFNQAEITNVSYANADFNAPVSFTGITVHNELNLQSITLAAPLDILYADIEAIAIKDITIRSQDAPRVIRLVGSTIGAGALHVQADSLYYDMTCGTLGDIDFDSMDESTTLFKAIRINNTTFDGFDFSTYETDLRDVRWQLHTTSDTFLVEPTDYTAREKTYLKAKNGAEQVGETRAAAEFFRRELLNRRYTHLERARTSALGSRDWAVASYQWLANRVFELSAGYGERPRATIKTTFITIVAFAGLYWLLLPTPPYDIGLAGYLLFSLASFVTLILGSVTPPTDPIVQFLAQLEGLLGAFLIALFVFTLTRSVHR